MGAAVHVPRATVAPAPSFTPTRPRVLQRCGEGPCVCCGEAAPPVVHEVLDSPPDLSIASAFDFSTTPVHSERSARLQPKLPVSTPGDSHERQADAMADRVMRMSDADLSSRQPDPTRPSQYDGGNMERETQSFMQRRFGADFSGVRIHTGGSAARMSRELNAHAFTIGRDVYFAPGHYAPGSDRGRHLLAHELAHTVQQGYSRIQRRSGANQQGITGLVDRPEESSRYEQEEAAPAEAEEAAPVEPMIQRSATWKGAAVHETLNMAEIALGGDSPITWHMLNGTKLETTADADSAIKVPVVKTSGAGKKWTAEVDTVPAQEGSDDETVLGPGPWTKAVTKAAAGAVTGLAACAGAGNSTFSAHGKPSDDAVYKANRKHEDHHVSDDKAAFEAAIGTWDKKVQQAKDKRTKFKGASAAKATAALWAAMGNTPKKAARSYRSQGFAKGAAYHATATGGRMSISNPASNADCSSSSVDVTNPA
jgi:hypothetical protein